MSDWLTDLSDWLDTVRFATDDCKTELSRLHQLLELLVADKTALSKMTEAATKKLYPALLASQVKQVLNNYAPGKGEEGIAVRLVRTLTAGRQEGDLLIDKTMLFPLLVGHLHEISFGELVTLPLPPVGKMLAEEMAKRDLIDDEYVLVRFNLDSFEIADEMDEIELEEDSFIDDGLQDLDDETRQRLMLAFDDSSSGNLAAANSSSSALGKSVSGMGTLRLKAEPQRRDSVDFGAGGTAVDERAASSEMIREKLQVENFFSFIFILTLCLSGSA